MRGALNDAIFAARVDPQRFGDESTAPSRANGSRAVNGDANSQSAAAVSARSRSLAVHLTRCAAADGRTHDFPDHL